MAKANAEYINRLNKIKVLGLIREAHTISRADIVKQTGISAPTITRIVDSLIHNERLAVQEGVGVSNGGRPPLIVRFNAEANFVIGIDWGTTHIYGALSNLNAEPIVELDIPSSADNDFQKDVQKLIKLIDCLLENSKIDKQKLLGIGIAAAGYINRRTGIIEFSPNFNWEQVDIKTPLAKKFGVPVLVDNVSRVVALGELWYGIGKQINSFVLLNLGYGIGAGIIVNGKAFRGFDGISGEFGHTKIVSPRAEIRRCVCGKENCLESFASGRGIAETAQKRLADHPASVLHMLSDGQSERIDAKMVSDAAKAGDGFAIAVLEEAAEILGVSVANMTNILNPQAVILAGKVINAGHVFIDKLEETFRRETLRKASRPVKLIRTSLGDRGVVVGATSLILKEVLELKTI